MTPQTAGQKTSHARRLRGQRIITPHEYAVYETLLFRLRRMTHDIARGSYATIARLAGVGATVAKEAVAKLTALGLLAKQTHRLRVKWGWNQSQVASRQDANTYGFPDPSTEVAARPVQQGEASKEASKRLDNTRNQAPTEGNDLLLARQRVMAARAAAGYRRNR
jgi:hypothetical protein